MIPRSFSVMLTIMITTPYIVTMLVLFGLVLGSFVNALVFRLHYKMEAQEHKKKLTKKQLEQYSVTKGRSMCFHCKHLLGPLDLVPVFSWLFLRGKCRYCRKKIDDTPLTELLTPLGFVVSFLAWPYALDGALGYALFVLWLCVLVGFMALVKYDARWFLLPDKIVFSLVPLAIGFFVIRLVQSGDAMATFGGVIGAAAFLPGLFWVLHRFSGGKWIGFGDVKLGVVLALLVGSVFGAVTVLFVASLAGLLFAMPALLKGGAGMSSKIPFGPFLILGSIVAVLWAERFYARLLYI